MPSAARVVVETSPDAILSEEVCTEELQALGRQHGPTKLSTEHMTDLCLAPEGQCVCATSGAASAMGFGGDRPCWRVRLPWWTFSSQLLPYGRHMQMQQLLSSSSSSGSAGARPSGGSWRSG